MTKTLTEQWREGTLPDGKYYIKLEPNFTERYDVGYSEGGDFVLYNIEDIEEVLAPVPDYKMFQLLIGEQKFTEEMLENIINIRTEELLKLNAEYIKRVKKLEKKLAIATKALKDCYNDMKYCAVLTHRNQRILSVIKKALKEMEGVK